MQGDCKREIENITKQLFLILHGERMFDHDGCEQRQKKTSTH